MHCLVAHFLLEMPGQCLVEWPESQPAELTVEIEDYTIVLELVADKSIGVGRKGGAFTYAISEVHLRVSHMEEEYPPPVVRGADGFFDYGIQSKYFETRTALYAEAGREALNRLIRYFKYRLNTPLLTEISNYDPAWANAEWKNELGKEVGKPSMVIMAQPLNGMLGELDVKRLTSDNLRECFEFLHDPSDPSLTDELLSDAQSAWFDQKLRRCVLELAIACEIAVKRFFFTAKSPAGAAFDYLEDKGRLSIKVIELIDRICLEALGRSFKQDEPSHYKNIDSLFRCRNKVAHRGELTFRNDNAEEIKVDSGMVSDWWASVKSLRYWLEAHAREIG